MSKLRQSIKVLKGRITYQDTTAKKLFSLPKYCTLLRAYVHVKTAFNGSGTDLLDVGTSGNGDQFVNDHNLASLGFAAATLLDGGELTVVGPVLDVYGQYFDQNSNATEGEAVVIFEYADPHVNP